MASSHRRQLFFLGFLILFLELALIRFLAGNIWNLGYFPNLVLMGVFIGMGTGFLAHGRFTEASSEKIFRRSAYLLFFLTLFVTLVHPPMPGFKKMGEGDMGGELFFTIALRQPEILSKALFVCWFLFVISIFFSIAQATAKVFKKFDPLTAYTLDISGSICGILAFMGISALQIPASFWFVFLIPIFGFAAGPMLAGWSTRQKTTVLASILAVVALAKYQDTRLMATYFGENYRGPVEVTWSPYQKVEYANAPDFRHRVHVNGIGHQQMEDAEVIRHAFYQTPYDNRAKRAVGPIERVLVIGAGTGNDVAAALLNGAKHVDAVEIDPVIAKLGQRNHPLHPYQDSRVRLTVDDGRAFMTRAIAHPEQRYDLIIFALTDSLVKVSPMSQLRLENFLFTRESAKRALELLAPEGDLVLYNFYRQEWLIRKIERMLFEATGRIPRTLHAADAFAMMDVRESDPVQTSLGSNYADVEPPTDDWPFLYLRKPAIPIVYRNAMALVSLFVLGLLGFAARSRKVSPDPRLGQGSWAMKVAFLLMGAAFLLLETKSVIQFALLFGTTWLNNSLVFLAVLASVLAANWAALVLKRSQLPAVYGALILACVVAYFFPLAQLLGIESTLLRFLAAGVLTFSPIFFANLIFSVLFREQEVPDQMFGWNLIGAVLGGVIEYFSMITGYNALAWVVAGCYVGVLIFASWAHARGPEALTIRQGLPATTPT